ncbi:DUF2460 domain-containing protein [Roseovarius sp. MBR-6]|uniref:DUF2460 domain-containing protein n=1 Tax=Roseovarius sp. MBR-6 TaxID=3156459 RepID=UPI0033950DE9
MAFHEVRFPDNISRGARGGPERRTQIVELASGDEKRNASWANSRRRYDVAYGIRRADDLAAVVAFFEARNGRLHGFRFKDWGDHKSCLPSGTPSPTDQTIGTGDGTTTAFQLVKRYTSGAQSWTRAIAKPVAGTVRIAISGVEQPSGWSVDTATGVVTFGTARMRGRLVLNGTTEIRGSVGEISATHVSLATAIWLQTMVPLTAGDTVELQGYFRVADGYFAADHTSFWGCKVG